MRKLTDDEIYKQLLPLLGLGEQAAYWEREALRARSREEVLEEVIHRLLKAREAGMSLSDMRAMARDAGVEL